MKEYLETIVSRLAMGIIWVLILLITLLAVAIMSPVILLTWPFMALVGPINQAPEKPKQSELIND